MPTPFRWRRNAFGGDFRAFPSYPKSWENLQAAWMEKTVNVPNSWKGKRLVLHFGAVGGKMVVFVNGKRIGQGFDIFFAQEYDVTDAIKLGADNQILVKVVSSHSQISAGRYGRREYIAGSFWGQFVSGLWQDVFLFAEPKVAVSDIFVQSWVDKDELKVEATVTNYGSEIATVNYPALCGTGSTKPETQREEMPEVKWELGNKDFEAFGQSVKIAPGESQTIELERKSKRQFEIVESRKRRILSGLLLNLSVRRKKDGCEISAFRLAAIYSQRK